MKNILILISLVFLLTGCFNKHERNAHYAKSGLEQCVDTRVHGRVIWVKDCLSYTKMITKK